MQLGRRVGGHRLRSSTVLGPGGKAGMQPVWECTCVQTTYIVCDDENDMGVCRGFGSTGEGAVRGGERQEQELVREEGCWLWVRMIGDT